MKAPAPGGLGEVDVAPDLISVLAETGALLADSIDFERTLRQVARLAVPRLADWCTVDLLEDDGAITRVAAAHTDRATERLIRALGRSYPMKLDEPRGISTALRERRSVLQGTIDEANLRTSARDARHYRVLASLLPSSALIVPLIARGRRLGALSFTFGPSGRRYTESDVGWAEALAGRAAIAIDNARLYQEARDAEEKLLALNAELAEAVKLRDEFLTAAAHELKTPVTSLRGVAQLLLRSQARGAVEPDRVERSMRTIDTQSARLARLIERLLDTSLIAAGELTIKPELVDVVALTRGLADLMSWTAPRHPVVLQAEGPTDAWIDPVRFDQVMTNLLENAVRFSPAGSTIEVEIDARGADEVRVAVGDRGVGIDPSEREGLFGRFHRTRRGHLGGLGLGLHLSREIVRLHGGDIEVEHPAAGGTRVVVRLRSTPNWTTSG